MQTITPQALAEKQSSETIDLVDVRTPAEYGEVHAVGAVNQPLDSIDPAGVQAGRNGRSEEPLYLICKSGSRSAMAVKKFVAQGIENVVSVEGGTSAWDAAGLPVVRGKKAISLERQVRIAAGSLVVIGSALGFFIDPRWIGISAFVGCGLVFAGVTDTCGMGMMLAKMPWNK